MSLRATLVQRWLDVVYGTAPRSDDDYGGPVPYDDAGSMLAGEVIDAGKPALIARLGSTELSVITYRSRWRSSAVRLPYLPAIRRNAHVASGIYPTDDASLDRFSDVLLDALSDVDVLGVWHNRGEHRIVTRYAPNARLVHLDSLNCVLHPNPWSAHLEGKTVLVVHPFTQTIESQYRERRTLLHSNPRLLPEFVLKTYAPVQSVAGITPEFPSWFDALAHMQAEIAEINFDVAVIGAGAYGLPIGASVKRSGRQAVHLGGVTQLLFGIKGRRWEVESPDIACLFNEHWVRPSADETPEGYSAVEGGCYW
ncbi:MAG: hypothetical protein HY876_03890 [Coriobacteriales bacterium]|nr:hypothetical protein [Coriobacteriales bacterium]